MNLLTRSPWKATFPRRDDEKISRFDTVGPGYFSTVGIPLLRGREIGPQDTGTSTKVAVINETFANKFFAGRNPIGYHITSTFGKKHLRIEVIGVPVTCATIACPVKCRPAITLFRSNQLKGQWKADPC